MRRILTRTNPMPDLVAMSNLVFTAPSAFSLVSSSSPGPSVRSSSEPRKRFRRADAFEQKIWAVRDRHAGFLHSAHETSNHRVFGDRGSRNLSGRRIFGRPDGFRGPLSVALSFLPY